MTNEERRLLREHYAFDPATRAELKTRLDVLAPGGRCAVVVCASSGRIFRIDVTLEDFNIAIAELTLLGKL